MIIMRRPFRAAVACLFALCTASLTVAFSPAPAWASSPVTAVYYSGLGCAGLPQAGAAARRLREQAGPCIPGLNGGTGFYNGRWASSTHCDPSHATYPATLNGHPVTQLVGFSLGRLGPLYLLRASSSLAAKVNSIIMLDPGSSEIAGNDCDTNYNSAGNLASWLARSSANRLVIIAGTDTQANGYAGINNVYLSSLSVATRKAQVLVCAANLSHASVMSTYGPQLIGQVSPSTCPGGSVAADIPASPPPPSPPARPIFTVMNTSETPPDGVWFRNSPQTANTDRVTGHGVYASDKVRLHCYAYGDAVGPYKNRLWYYVDNVTRPVVSGNGAANVGYLNAHYINDGAAANQVDAGVPPC